MSQSSDFRRVRKLVDILLTKDEKAFEAFAAFLKVNGQAEFNQFFNVYCSLQYWSGTIQLPGRGWNRVAAYCQFPHLHAEVYGKLKYELKHNSIIGICSVTGIVWSTTACNIVPSFTSYVYTWPLASWHASPLHLNSTWPCFTTLPALDKIISAVDHFSITTATSWSYVVNDAPYCITLI